MELLFHIRPDFASGGITEDALTIFEALLEDQDVGLSSLIMEPSYEVLGKKRHYSLKGRLVRAAKFVLRQVLPKAGRIYLRRALTFVKALIRRGTVKAATSSKHPLVHVGQEDKAFYLKRFENKIQAKHLQKLMETAAFMVNRTLGGYDLPMDKGSYDYVFFPFFVDPSALPQDKGLLVRLHDISFITDEGHVGVEARELKQALDGAIRNDKVLFICNSPYTVDALEAYAPQVKGRTFLVPCQVPRYETLPITKADLKAQLADYLSNRHLKWYNRSKVARCISRLDEYVLVVGGEHARKNYEALLEGWQAYNCLAPEKIPLIWVGYECGQYTGTFIKDAKPLINKGEIIHLEKVPRELLNQLFMHASVFVVASHDEGFSMPPVEAQQFRCPVIASDITVHRWVLGKGALFFDPGAPEQLCDRLSQVLGAKADIERVRLQALGEENAQRFYKKSVVQILKTVLHTITQAT